MITHLDIVMKVVSMNNICTNLLTYTHAYILIYLDNCL